MEIVYHCGNCGHSSWAIGPQSIECKACMAVLDVTVSAGVGTIFNDQVSEDKQYCCRWVRSTKENERKTK